jgi:hypothetical protein
MRIRCLFYVLHYYTQSKEQKKLYLIYSKVLKAATHFFFCPKLFYSFVVAVFFWYTQRETKKDLKKKFIFFSSLSYCTLYTKQCEQKRVSEWVKACIWRERVKSETTHCGEVWKSFLNDSAFLWHENFMHE